MSRMSGYLHPNRVHVNELPVDVTKEELQKVFLQFNVGIRYVRVVQTGGATNYGFLTFESKEDADTVIREGQSERGILIRGKKIPVNRAFSRRNPPRRNSRQFSAALQCLVPQNNQGLTQAPTSLLHPNHNFSSQFAPEQQFSPEHQFTPEHQFVPEQQFQNSPNRIHYSLRMHQYNPFTCLNVPSEQLYVQPANAAVSPSAAQGAQFPHMSPYTHGNVQSPPVQWQMHGGTRYTYDVNDVPLSGPTLQSYLAAPGYVNPIYVHEPLEGLEAPNLPQWSDVNESAATQRHPTTTEPMQIYHNVQPQTYHQRQQQEVHFTQQAVPQNQSLRVNRPYHEGPMERKSPAEDICHSPQK